MGAAMPTGAELAAFLETLGFETDEAEPLIAVVLCSVAEELAARTGLPAGEVPAGLFAAALYLAAGEYLALAKDAGLLADVDLSAAVTRIDQGDTSVAFADASGGCATPEQRLDTLARRLAESGERRYIAFRRLVW